LQKNESTMRRLTYLLFIWVFFCGCESQTPLPEEPEPKIFVHAFYKEESGSSKYPDFGSKVYVYYGIYLKADRIYIYNWDGSITDKETSNTIYADQEATIDYNGDAVLIPKYIDRLFSIIVESNHYPGRIGSAAYTERALSTYGDVRFTTIQSP